MHSEGSISIWFFIGISLLGNGLLILERAYTNWCIRRLSRWCCFHCTRTCGGALCSRWRERLTATISDHDCN